MKSEAQPQQVSTTPPASDKAGPRLPHEHDESHDSQKSGPRDSMKQAHADIASGQVDTDLHGQRGVEAAQDKTQDAGKAGSAAQAKSTGASAAPKANAK